MEIGCHVIALATDDGSLSVYAGQRGRPYVNVEAQHGHAREQRRMFEALMDLGKDAWRVADGDLRPQNFSQR